MKYMKSDAVRKFDNETYIYIMISNLLLKVEPPYVMVSPK